MTIKSLTITSLCLGLCGLTAEAAANGTTLPYSYLAAGYTFDDYDYIGVKGTGVILSGSYALPYGLLVVGSYAKAETDRFRTPSGLRGSIDTATQLYGLGLRLPLADKLDLVTSFQYQYSTADYNGQFSVTTRDESYEGNQFDLILRSSLRKQLELFGGYSRNHIADRDDNSFRLGAVCYPSTRFGLSLMYSQTDIGEDFATARSDRYSSVALSAQINF